MKQIVNKDSWERYNIFKHYDSETNPFVYVNTPLDVTKLYSFCKESKNSFYATLGYIILDVCNSIDGFRMRKENEDIFIYDKVFANFTENIDDKRIDYFTIRDADSYQDFVESFKRHRQEIKEGRKRFESVTDHDEIWISCEPWFIVNSIVTPFDRKITIPQIIWDKFRFDDNKVSINLTVMAHHGFVDGYHIGVFINKLQEKINSFKGEI